MKSVKGDVWLAIVVIVGAAIYLYLDLQLPEVRLSDPLGPKAFPALVGVGLISSALLLLFEGHSKARHAAHTEAPEIGKVMGFARFPRVDASVPSKPPLGGFNLAVSAFSDNQDVAFEAAACLADKESQKTAVELDGLLDRGDLPDPVAGDQVSLKWPIDDGA